MTAFAFALVDPEWETAGLCRFAQFSDETIALVHDYP
jgi:hypothetical protein